MSSTRFVIVLEMNLAPCSCTYKWCQTLRFSHLFGSSTVKLPTDTRESEIWATLLGINVILPTTRVSIIHFFEVDIIVKSNSNGDAIFGCIDRTAPTKYQLSDTGNSSVTSPARPAAPKSEILNSLFSSTRKLTYADYVRHASSWSKIKKSRSLKRKEKNVNNSISTASSEYFASPPASSAFSSFFDTSMESLKAGRKPEIPFYENFIGSSVKLVTLIKVIHEHGNSCQGSIIIQRNLVVLKRLSLQVSVKCSLRHNCQKWENGLFKWVSLGQIPVPNTSRMACVPDVLYALATYLTPTTKAHAEQFFSAMLLTPPSKNTMNDVVKSFVAPYLTDEKERIVDLRCSELKSLNQGLIINMDVGYTGARKAQCATIMVGSGSGSRAVLSRTDTENGAWLKKGLLVSLALDEAINIRKLDIVALEIDDNSANKKKIENFKRINGPILFQQETVKGLNDVFHSAKSMGRQAVKIVTLFAQQIQSKIKPLIAVYPTNWKIVEEFLDPVLNKLEYNFQLYFSDINEKFRSMGAEEWTAASASIESMQEFAKGLNLVDETINYDYWRSVVDVWNRFKPPSSPDVENISGILITKTTSMRCLIALAAAVSKLLDNSEDNELSKKDAIGYLRLHLPSVCFRGDNFSVNFTDCIDEKIKELIHNSQKVQTEVSAENKNKLLKEIFGSKIPTSAEIKKLKSDKIVRLAQYLDYNLPSPMQKQDVKEAREHCARNIWRLQGLLEDVEAAISIAQRTFSARIGEYKKLMKTLIRVVNETYGLWSVRFKMNFVLNGLLNFSDHFCNDHSSCSRYIWWTQCSNAHINEYLSTQEYINNITSGRGI